MRKLIALLAGTMLLPAAASAATTIDQRGTRLLNPETGTLAADGDSLGSAFWNGSSDPLPFDGFLGQDSIGPNFSAAWTHAYGPLEGAVTSATIELGLWEIDSIAPGNQVTLFTLNGIDLTALLNAAVEAKPYDSGIYGIYTLELPQLVHAQLLTGTSQFLLTLDNGRSLGTNRDFNGALIDFAKLTINTQAIDPGPDPIPEPATWAMMIAGFGLAGVAMRRRRVSVSYA